MIQMSGNTGQRNHAIGVCSASFRPEMDTAFWSTSRSGRVNRNSVNRSENYENPFVDAGTRLEPALCKQRQNRVNDALICA